MISAVSIYRKMRINFIHISALIDTIQKNHIICYVLKKRFHFIFYFFCITGQYTGDKQTDRMRRSFSHFIELHHIIYNLIEIIFPMNQVIICCIRCIHRKLDAVHTCLNNGFRPALIQKRSICCNINILISHVFCICNILFQIHIHQRLARCIKSHFPCSIIICLF